MDSSSYIDMTYFTVSVTVIKKKFITFLCISFFWWSWVCLRSYAWQDANDSVLLFSRWDLRSMAMTELERWFPLRSPIMRKEHESAKQAVRRSSTTDQYVFFAFFLVWLLVLSYIYSKNKWKHSGENGSFRFSVPRQVSGISENRTCSLVSMEHFPMRNTLQKGIWQKKQ